MKIILLTLLLIAQPIFAQENPYKYSPLVQAIVNGDLAAAEKELKSGADANTDKSWIYPPLALAIHKENAPMVDLLLRYKANPNIVDDYSRLPMDWAIQGRQMEIMKLLLKAGAELNVLSANRSYMERAFDSLQNVNDKSQNQFQKDAYLWLYVNGFTVEKSGASYSDILANAANYATKEILEDLFLREDYKSHINDLNYADSTPLISAIFNYRSDTEVAGIVSFLLSQGADPNKKVYAGSPLSAAQYMKRTEVIKVLLAAGAKP